MEKTFNDRMMQLIAEKNNLHPEDPRHTDYYYRLLELMKEDKASTAQFIRAVSDEKTILTISPTWEGVAAHFQSNDFNAVLDETLLKFKDSKLIHLLQMDVQQARNALG